MTDKEEAVSIKSGELFSKEVLFSWCAYLTTFFFGVRELSERSGSTPVDRY